MNQSTRLSTVRLEDLLRHRSWLERLARSLVLEEDAVDDLVQETWLVALKGEARISENPRAWLGGVARNLLRDRARREATRREMERQLVLERSRDPEALATLQQALTGKVLALDEPFRSTLLARYFGE